MPFFPASFFLSCTLLYHPLFLTFKGIRILDPGQKISQTICQSGFCSSFFSILALHHCYKKNTCCPPTPPHSLIFQTTAHWQRCQISISFYCHQNPIQMSYKRGNAVLWTFCPQKIQTRPAAVWYKVHILPAAWERSGSPDVLHVNLSTANPFFSQTSMQDPYMEMWARNVPVLPAQFTSQTVCNIVSAGRMRFWWGVLGFGTVGRGDVQVKHWLSEHHRSEEVLLTKRGSTEREKEGGRG